MTLRRRDVPTMQVSICRAVQTVRKAGCVELELLNRHIKQVKAEKNRNGRISDNGSNLFNALGCAFYVFMQVKHRIHTLTLAYVRLYQGAKSLLVELIIHFYALRRIILKQQK